MKYIRLSYDMSEGMPLYPGSARVSISKDKESGKGSSCNTFILKFHNHSGTHIDAPKHFFNKGRPINDYFVDELVFERPLMIDCSKGCAEAIGLKDLKSAARISAAKPDILLIRTGFSKYRNSNGATYTHKNPYLSPDAARWLREECLFVRAVGIDCISIASYSAREAGRKTHSILLGDGGFRGKPVLIIEDMALPRTMKEIGRIIVAPLFVDGIDSAPCTVIGIKND